MNDGMIDALGNASTLCVDIETKDPKLPTHGPGTHRGDGYICGVGFGAGDAAMYLPTNHKDLPSEAQENNRKIIQLLLSKPSAKLGTNIIYDLEWLLKEGFSVNMSTIHDVQYAEPLLDEYARSYSLSKLADKYSAEEKKTDILDKYCEEMNWKGDARKHIWKMPSALVGEYVIGDVTLPQEIFDKQQSQLEAEGLMDVYTMETELIPSLLKMRKNGVKIDQKRFKKAITSFTERRFKLEKELEKELGSINMNSTAQLAKVFDKMGIPYPKNPPTALMKEKGKEGNPNIDKLVLAKLSKDYPICNKILDYRQTDTMINMFLWPYMDLMCEGRLYGQFHPLRSDDYGTVAGRFSASKPNLQQVSAIDVDDDEDEQMKGKVLRSLFVPEEGCDWAKLDYSQIEYRIMAHYAEGATAEKLRQQYINDPGTDMHQVICDATGFDRRTAKRLNFGGAYGMGVKTASGLFGWTFEEADVFMSSYHQAAPYVKQLRRTVSDIAARRGHIFTILGRKARTHPSRKLHSMFNRLIQGSAADVMKKAMVDADKKGLFEELILHLTVHDELDVSVPKTASAQEALKELEETMIHAVEFDVPILVDCHTGHNWAEAD